MNILPPSSSFQRFVMLSIYALAATVSNAATVTQVTSNTSNTTSWLTTSTWSSNLAPAGGNDYVVNNATFRLRTPTSAQGGDNPVFAGDSLTFSASGSDFLFQHTGTVTVNNLSFSDNGLITLGTSVSTGLAGSIDIQNTMLTVDLGSSGRNLEVFGSISGTGSVYSVRDHNTPSGNPGFFRLSADNSGFSGDWSISSKCIATVTNAMGTGNITVNAVGTIGATYFNSDVDINSPSAALTIAGTSGGIVGQLYLDQNLTFGSATFGSTSLAPGTYNYADLNTMGLSGFLNGDQGGSLTVVPEPSMAFLAPALIAFLVAIRQGRNRRLLN